MLRRYIILNAEAVSARRPARSEGEGCRAVRMEQIDGVLGDFSLIINTVPALILDAERLKLLRPQTLVLDLASKPGGDGVGDSYGK